MKQEVIDYIKNQLEERMQAAWGAMQAAQASANEESKSSAGDKHETSKAMMQLEIEKLGTQLKEAEELSADFEKINFNKSKVIQNDIRISNR